jgi:hypothetical protein
MLEKEGASGRVYRVLLSTVDYEGRHERVQSFPDGRIVPSNGELEST